MRKLTIPITLCLTLMFPALASAEETTISEDVVSENAAPTSSLKANIKRLAFEYMEHSVTNKEDENYPDTYNANEERSIGGVFDGNITYDASSLVWINGLFMNYNKSKTTENGVTSENEKDDEILLYTDYTHKIWQLEHGIIGPFAYLGYETEFTDFDLVDKNGRKHSYRNKILRGKTGLKLYDGKYFKQLYVAVVEEDDMTYHDDNMKSGGEIGYEFNYPINESTTFISEGFYRHFFSYSERNDTDFKYKLELNNRIETKLTGDLYLAPFYNYELAETRGAKKSRAQTTLGLSLTYNKSFDL